MIIDGPTYVVHRISPCVGALESALQPADAILRASAGRLSGAAEPSGIGAS